MGTLSFDEAYDIFAEQVRAAVAAGCDIILVETMADLREAKAALLAARENSTLPVFVAMTFGEDGRTFLGTTPEIAAEVLSSLGAQAVGLNCSLGPAELTGATRAMASRARCPFMAQPMPACPIWKTARPSSMSVLRSSRAQWPSARCRREHRRRLLRNKSPIDRAAFKRDRAPREACAARLQTCLRSCERPGSGCA